MLVAIDYFYDAQQTRFLEQIIRTLSGLQYMTGANSTSPPSLVIVPCRMAQTNTVVASIMKNQSDNTLLVAPMMTVYQTGLSFRPEALQNPSHVDRLQIVEREVDEQTGKYTGARGKSYTVERLMPLPFNMEIQIDLWTSNLDQKYQISEQMLQRICPYFDIQNSDNGADWSALTTAYVEDITWTSRSIPVGSDSQLDIMSVKLRLPMWISPPARVKQQTIIEQIVTNINDTSPLPGVIADAASGERFSQIVTTPGNHHIRVEGNIITLLGEKGSEHDDQGNVYVWQDLLDEYGAFRPAASQLYLKTTPDIEGPSLVGTLQTVQNQPNQLMWQIDPDTLPANTLAPVNAIINPLSAFPGHPLPAAAEGQRYLLIHDLGPSQAWGQISARYGDIIEFNNGVWVVAFTAMGSGQQYVLNLNKGNQLRWTGDDWVMAIDAEYPPGHWRLKL